MLFAALMGSAMWPEGTMGYTAIWAGYILACIGVMPLLFSFIMPFLIRNVPLKHILAFCFFIFIVGFVHLLTLTNEASFKEIAISRMVIGVGFALHLAPITTLCLKTFKGKDPEDALSFFNFIRNATGGAGISILIAIRVRRDIFHHSNIASQLNNFNPITNEALSTLGQTGLEGKQSLQLLNNLTDQQTGMPASNDLFLIGL